MRITAVSAPGADVYDMFFFPGIKGCPSVLRLIACQKNDDGPQAWAVSQESTLPLQL